ncbi:MAG: PAS domain S-box protein [Limnospira sp. PMC 1291.21]|uniref:PAS domain S-box protein n=1 Tax=unclassified Limnospira TaxID=2642885 RepID=UPI0028E0E71E|nr:MULTISPECIES: PAS domain S-box protein [unclassified Limnospira]MDT9180060.1 PAS domain S-box protein [Limnospira sp. PMC 1238.20]MDT9195332.1 PAS domain S-box protein [Limnospira sp. PMC 1245.20]MDT9205563.1 PAS domain S-box protein [Limnospira sp. PMC 1243.20]MDT9210685.1 PAS domain S-box protein [Limnospira sp. PMC 1252.20]MDT9215795.1 PAS domain S-box protein [Limnospira sp. PMC 1256.20]
MSRLNGRVFDLGSGVLRQIGISPDISFDDITRLTIHITNAPIAFISFIDQTHQWLKAQIGLSDDLSVYLDFCGYAIAYHRGGNLSTEPDSPTSQPIIIQDISTHPKLANHAIANNEQPIKSYLGVPITTRDGYQLGMLSVMTYECWQPSSGQIIALESLSRQVANQVNLHRQLMDLHGKLSHLETIIQERRKVWDIVRQERDFVNAVLDTISALVVVIDPEGQIVRFNKSCEQLTGYKAGDVEGLLIEDLGLSIFDQDWESLNWGLAAIEFDDPPPSSHQVQSNSIRMGHFPRQCENLWEGANGDSHLVAWSNSAIRNPDGSLRYILGCGIDITNRKQSEEMLHLLQRAIEASPNGIVISENTKNDLPIIYCNAAFEKLTGYTKEEVIGQNCRFLQGPETHEDAIAMIRQSIKRKQGCKVTLKNYRKNGSCFWNELAISPVRDHRGKLTHFIGIQTDITERKQSEDALRESEARYRLLADHATDLISRHDAEGIYIYASPACRDLLGYEPEELIGISAYNFFHPDDRERIQKSHQTLLSNSDVDTVSYRVRRSDGSFIWFETTSHAIRNQENNDIQEIVSISRDITERKQAEEILRERSHLSLLEAEVGKALGQGGTIPTILNRCAKAMDQYLKVAGVSIWTINSQTNQLERQAGAGIVTLKAPTPQLWNHELSQMSQQMAQLSHQTLEVPLVVEGRLMGMMAICSSNPLSPQVQDVLGWIANAIAVGIDRVKAREELQSRREALLFRLASQIRNSLDIDTILGTAVQEIRSVLQIDQCHFLWYLPTQPNRHNFAITHESRSPSLSTVLEDYPSDKIGWLAHKICNRETVQVNNLQDTTVLDATTRGLLEDAGIASEILLPLETRSGQRGAVVCNQYNSPRDWIDSDVELLRAVVDQLAIAIDQAELYAQTRAAALAAQTQAFHLSEALQDLQQKESQLIQSEKMSSLGQMVAGVAHEINNPVNFIYGNLTYARDYTKDLLELVELYQEQYPEPLEVIQERIEDIDLDFLVEDLPKILSSMEMGADRIRQIVVSLRNFSRLDEAEMKPVDIHEGIDSTLLILQNRLKAKGSSSGIELVKKYGQLPRVECYAGQLNQVFMNILSNAIDALDNQPDPRMITITTEVVSISSGSNLFPLPASDVIKTTSEGMIKPPVSKSQQVLIQIHDNGQGIPEDLKNRLFDPFFTTKPVGKGTGLGLSISYRIIVEKHGGSLKCISKPGDGCTFAIQIPIQPPPELKHPH